MLKGDSLEDLPEDFEVRMDQMDVYIGRYWYIFLPEDFLTCFRGEFLSRHMMQQGKRARLRFD